MKLHSMKLLTKSKTFRIVLFMVLGIYPLPLISAELSAITILDSMAKVMQPVHSKGKMKQEIITSSNIRREFTFNYFSEFRGKNILIRYIEPQKVKHNAFLIKNNGDDIWVYFPRSNRVRKLASYLKKHKAQGSDFFYEDFSGINEWKSDYNVKKRPSGERKNYLLVLKTKPHSDKSYDSLKIYVNKFNFYPDRIMYYQDKNHLKTLYFQDIQDIQGIPTAMHIRMENHIEESQTSMRILEMDYNVVFDQGFFTKQNLIK